MVEKNLEQKPGENTPSLQQSWAEVDEALKDANWKIENSEIEKKVVQRQEEGMIVDEQASQSAEENKNESILSQIKNQRRQSQKAENQHDGGVYQNDEVTVKQYFGYYAKLANQQNMLQDSVRTELYRNAIIQNPTNFRGKVVMDVGCGSGILSLFAA